MAKLKAPQRLPSEANSFVGGLVTDSNPNNPLENSVKDINNIVINRNGQNSRRLGIDYETSAVSYTTTQNSSDSLSFNTYKWENVGGNSDKALLCIQVGTQFTVFDLDTIPISSGNIYNRLFTSITADTTISFSQADGYLVAVNGDGYIYTYEYDAGTITETSERLMVRDLWGVEDVTSGDDLRSAAYVATRPTTLTPEHAYNLRNQTWGIERPTDSSTSLQDPIDVFKSSSSTLYPSNSDSVNYAFYEKAADTSNPTLMRFWPSDLVKNKIGSYETSRGHFVIDALTRGISRLEQDSIMRADNTSLTDYVTTLPEDTTTGGATSSVEYAGRVFYAGFQGDITDGDNKSPDLSSHLLFSRIVRDKSDITQCYQEADPTSFEDPEIVATDGGFIRVDGAYNIVSLKAAGSSLIILAQNGVWRLIGGSDYGFSADNYLIEKLSDEGCRSPKSVVYVENQVMFWGDNGIYVVGADQLGDWKVTNFTRDRIQDLYDGILVEDKVAAYGLYDKYERKIRWVYNNRIGSTSDTKELVFDVDLKAFYLNTIPSITTAIPKVVAIAETNPFIQGDVTTLVEVNGDQVQVNGDDVTMTSSIRGGLKRELVYLTLTQLSPAIEYTLSLYIDGDFMDWVSYDSTGVDAEAYFITNEFKTGDNQRRKQVGTLMVHMERTEDGVTTDDSGAYVPDNQSSCLVQARWDWSNSANSNRWSVPRQFYRYKRHYLPADINDSFDTGFETIVSKDIIRGHGKALSLRFSSEAGKDLKVNGWSAIWEIGDSEGD